MDQLLLLLPSDSQGFGELGSSSVLLEDLVHLLKKCLEKGCFLEAGQVLSVTSNLLASQEAGADHEIQTALETARNEYLAMTGALDSA